jgi:hypothetical protein
MHCARSERKPRRDENVWSAPESKTTLSIIRSVSAGSTALRPRAVSP